MSFAFGCKQAAPKATADATRSNAANHRAAEHLGNQAALRRLSAAPVRLQPKLTIGAVDDPLEHEADRVAEAVMRMPEPAPEVSAAPPQVSCKCAECQEEDEAKVQMKPAASLQAEAVEAPPIEHEVRGPNQPQRQPTRAAFETRIALPRSEKDRWIAGPAPPAISILGPGRPLTPTERQLAPGPGAWADVRVHDDRSAQVMANLLGDAGFAVGEHVALADASPSRGRDRLLAHELAHAFQQTAAGRRPASLDAEREAEHFADEAMRGGHERKTLPGAAPRGFAEAVVARHTQDLGNGLLLIIDVDSGDFVGGCVKAIVPHIGVKLIMKGVPKAQGNQLFNIHMGITENPAGESCFFFYESVSGLCEMKCFPTLDELKKALEEIRDWIKEKVEQVLKYLLPAAIAAIAAYLIADAIVAALAAAGILVLA